MFLKENYGYLLESIGEGKIFRFFQGPVDTESELMLIIRYLKCTMVPLLEYKGQVINGVLAQALFTVGPLGLLNHTLIISSNS